MVIPRAGAPGAPPRSAPPPRPCPPPPPARPPPAGGAGACPCATNPVVTLNAMASAIDCAVRMNLFSLALSFDDAARDRSTAAHARARRPRHHWIEILMND